MDSRRILALVLAGGEGTRLRPLTTDYAKPALPFVSNLRLIDFVLSNLINSKISQVYVIAQYKPRSLITHINATWARWSRGERASVELVLPEVNSGAGPFKGTADAVFRNLDLIVRHSPDLVAVFAADHVYRMDIQQMVHFHRERNADVTVAAVRVGIEVASAFGVMVTGPDGAIHEFQEKPERPPSIPEDSRHAHVSMGNYIFDPCVLVGLLKEASQRNETDFGHHLLPRMPGRQRIFAYDLMTNRVPGVQPYEEHGYWRDVGTLDALAAARRDTLGPHPRFDLRNREWPIRPGCNAQRVPRIQQDTIQTQPISGSRPAAVPAAVDLRAGLSA